jgi:hypothetical protein
MFAQARVEQCEVSLIAPSCSIITPDTCSLKMATPTPTTATGGCFCGKVRIEYSGQPMTVVGDLHK